jgi:hypothetical protein
MVDALEIRLMMEKILAELVHVSPNDMPGFLIEEIVKTIWARRLIRRKIKNDPINFLRREGKTQKFKIGMPLNQILKIKLHGHTHRGTQPPFEFLPEDRT